jgi:hypothetical protein
MNEDFAKYLVQYRPLDVIMNENDDSNDFFCLLQGEIGVWRGDSEDPSQLVKISSISEKGTYFGEMSSLLEEKRTATITAQTRVKALKFPGEMLNQMILTQPKLGVKLCTALAARLKGSLDQQECIAVQRNEIRDESTLQFTYTREAFQKLFIMLTSVQAQLQHPILKQVVEHISHDRLLQSGKKIMVDEHLIKDMPDQIQEMVRKAYSDLLV